MAEILRDARLQPVVGAYSIRLQHCPNFVFQEYGGDLGDPVIEADAETLPELLRDAARVSKALAKAGVAHRFEIYDGQGDAPVRYFHHEWPPGNRVSDEIKTVTACEAIRLRPERFLMPGENRRNFMVLEGLCLSIAEAHCGTCTAINIAVAGRSAVISDNGLGLSMERNAAGAITAAQLFTNLYACRDHKAHKEIAHELCGAGIAVVNALSESFCVEVHTGGSLHRLAFRDGVEVHPFQIAGPTERTGNVLRLTIAEQFAGTEEFDIEALHAAIRAKPVDFSRVEITIANADA